MTEHGQAKAMPTLVIQSHTDPLPFNWLKRCTDSVRQWSDTHAFSYRWLGDELFSYVDEDLLKKAAPPSVIATDLARLKVIQNALEDYERVLWFDADFLIFSPENFVLPNRHSSPMGYLLGREVWVQQQDEYPEKLKAFVKVHNAFLLCDRSNSFLDFYIEHAEQLVNKYQGSMPPQFIGPKLLTALHNVLQCPVQETAGMLCPLVIRDILSDGKSNAALTLMRKRSKESLAGANLCSSLVNKEGFNEAQMAALIDRLLKLGACL